MSTAAAAPPGGTGALASAPGPIFVSGRQHSGNTVVAVLLGRVPDCLAQLDENAFFEYRAIVDRIRDPLARARRVFELMRVERDGAREEALRALLDFAGARADASAVDLYREGMRLVTAASDKRFWVQKATSYIFHGREILTLMPEARLIYLVRNPYDIAASKKRRELRREYVWNTIVGWNKGARIAAALSREFPARFRAMRYEDLTGRPEETVSALFAFLGLRFDLEYLDVPHVNRSETRYSLTGDGKGLSRARVNYYMENLSASEIAALDLLAATPLLERFGYTDLPHRRVRRSVSARLRGALLVAAGPARYAWDCRRRLRRGKRYLLRRTLHRLR